MKIEIENAEDFRLASLLHDWLKVAAELWLIRPGPVDLKPEGLPMAVATALFELGQALDDYRQIHYPLGGEPKP